MHHNLIRVPHGCPTVEKAMALAKILSERKEYTKADPLKIRLDMGVHEIVGNGKVLNVTCSHITFVGAGKSQTTIRGGFRVENQQNVTFEELVVTNPTGYGMRLHGSETNVDLLKCVVKEGRYDGMYAVDGATVTATQCAFTGNGGCGAYCGTNTTTRLNDCTVHHNGETGIYASRHAVVDLHGTKTEIHSNKKHGIYASIRAKVNIHLPSQHNTSHDNNISNNGNGNNDGIDDIPGEDRLQESGGSIANINADGTFTHVVVDNDADN